MRTEPQRPPFVLGLIAATVLLAGCAQPAPAPAEAPPASGESPRAEECSGFQLHSPWAGHHPRAHVPAGWETAEAVTAIKVQAWACQRISWGPFERGPVRLLFETHNQQVAPEPCRAVDEPTTFLMLQSLWTDDAGLAEHLAGQGLPALWAPMASADAPALGGVRTSLLPYLQVTAGGGTLAGTGRALALAAGGPWLDADVVGWLRLPDARAQGPCDGCVDPAGATYYAEGELGLSALRQDGDRLAADLDGSPTRVRVGESWVPLAAGAATAVGLLAAIVAAKALAVALGSRVSRPGAEAHPARQRLLEVVRAQPGMGLRETLRAAGMPYATGLHHLGLLTRHGLVCFVPQGRRMRVFAGKAPAVAPAPIVATDRAVGALHDLLLTGAVAFQSDILAHAQTAWGWKASTTRHRLGRLARSGLAERRVMGRRVAYLATASQGLRVAATSVQDTAAKVQAA